jgi:uncharacterized protein with GYD domain
MPHFVMLTRLQHDGTRSPKSLLDLESQVMKSIRSECPKVKWLHNFVILGPYDYLDVFSAPDQRTALKVATLIRTFGHAHTEVWSATEWDEFKEVVNSLPARY